MFSSFPHVYRNFSTISSFGFKVEAGWFLFLFPTNLIPFRLTFHRLVLQLLRPIPNYNKNNRNNHFSVCSSLHFHSFSLVVLVFHMRFNVIGVENSVGKTHFIHVQCIQKTKTKPKDMLNPIFYRANIIRKWITDPEKLTDLQKNGREYVNAPERDREWKKWKCRTNT